MQPLFVSAMVHLTALVRDHRGSAVHFLHWVSMGQCYSLCVMENMHLLQRVCVQEMLLEAVVEEQVRFAKEEFHRV